VLDVSQLPAEVPAVLCGSTIPVPYSRDEFIAVIPDTPREVEWRSRFIHYSSVKLSTEGTTEDDPETAPTNQCLAKPNQRLRLQFEWESRFEFHPPDVYRPGCVVQVYVGIGNVFSKGFIEHGVRTDEGTFE
jgi:hypothetical protein